MNVTRIGLDLAKNVFQKAQFALSSDRLMP